jgi:hypothetical protein
MRAILRFLVGYLGLSLFLGLLWLASSFPDLPSSPKQWLWLFLLALPLQLAAELTGQILWNNRVARRVERQTQDKSLSLLRIGYGLACMLSALGVLAAAVYGWHLLRPLLAA